MTTELTLLNETTEFHYRGLTIHAIPSLHEQCLALIESLPLPPNPRVLELGAGEGAFTLRLSDAGFNVTAAELDQSRFRLDIPCLNIDLNLDFDDKWPRGFDLVVAIETLEHLHNPRHFIRNALNLLSDDGYLLITSPNVEAWLSRIRFLRNGHFLWFEDYDYQTYGHLTPILSWQMKQICTELGAELIQVTNTKNRLLRKRLGESLWSILRNKSTYLSVLYPLMMGRREGETSIYLIRKANADH